MAWDHWQAPDRDSVKTLEKVDVALGWQTHVLLQMEGAKGTVDAEVEARTGDGNQQSAPSTQAPRTNGCALPRRRR